jgi:hypothetical protein
LSQYNGHHWFIARYPYGEESYPDGTQRREYAVLRDDFDREFNNNEQTAFWLTDDPTLELWGGDWVPGADSVSFTGRRWSSTEADATIVEAGIYTAPLLFDSDGNITGLGALSPTPTIPFPLVESDLLPGFSGRHGLVPDLDEYSWAPNGLEVVYAIVPLASYSNPEEGLWVAGASGPHTQIFSGLSQGPQWSPIGDKIAFFSGGSIMTLKPNGRSLKTIVPRTSTWTFNWLVWSPDGEHLVFNGEDEEDHNSDLFRATASGGDLVQLTVTSAPYRETVVRWR